MNTCAQCGQENRDDAKFCLKCGSPLAAAAQPVAPPTQVGEAPGEMEAAPPPQPMATPQPPPEAAPSPTPPPQAAPTVGQPTAPTAYPPPAPPGGYPQAAAAAPRAEAYRPVQPPMGARTTTKGAAFWIGSALGLVAGVVVMISSFMAWVSGPFGFGSFSGWDLFDLIDNKFFDYASGYPMFTGLCSLIAGGLIVLIALIMLISRSKGLGVLVIIFSILALGMAVTNLTSILREPAVNLNVGIGIYLFLIFSFLGVVGGGTAMAG